MVDFFNQLNPSNGTINTYGDLDNLKNKFKLELSNYKNYMYGSEIIVPNKNRLVKIIDVLQTSLDLSIFDYVGNIKRKAESSLSIFGLTHVANKGVASKDEFFDNDKVMYVHIEREVDYVNISKWKDLEIIKTIYTENLDINYYSKGLKFKRDKSMFTIFELDIVELMIAYRYWALDRIFLELDTEPSAFVARYVFPKVWDTMLDLTILNRFTHIYNGWSMSENYTPLPYSFIDPTRELDGYLEMVLDGIKKSRKKFPDMLSQIPTVNTNMNALLTLNFFQTTHTKWVAWLSRIQVTMLLVSLSEDSGSERKNKIFTSDFNYIHRRLRNGLVQYPSDVDEVYIMEINAYADILKEK